MRIIFKSLNFLIMILFVTSCNPFGKDSFVNISDVIQDLTNQKTNTSFNSGGSPTLTTVPPIGFGNHMVELSVGNQFQQTNYVSVQGNTLEVLVIGIIK